MFHHIPVNVILILFLWWQLSFRLNRFEDLLTKILTALSERSS